VLCNRPNAYGRAARPNDYGRAATGRRQTCEPVPVLTRHRQPSTPGRACTALYTDATSSCRGVPLDLHLGRYVGRLDCLVTGRSLLRSMCGVASPQAPSLGCKSRHRACRHGHARSRCAAAPPGHLDLHGSHGPLAIRPFLWKELPSRR